MDSGINFSLQDMRADDIYEDKKFSQELELSKSACFMEKRPIDADHHSCSRRIIEIDNLHKVDKEERLEYFSIVEDYYKDKFPIGGDTFLSGGNHYHIFFSTQDEVKQIREASDDLIQSMYNFILNLPLYAKFKEIDGSKVFFNRRNERFTLGSFMFDNSKWQGITAKTSYSSSSACSGSGLVQSIEFRMNNVISSNLYGYYQAAILYSIDKTEGIIKLLDVAPALYEGIQESFIGRADKDGCITLEDLYSQRYGVIMNKKEMMRIKHNYKIAISLLEKYGLKESVNSLKLYASEYNIFN